MKGIASIRGEKLPRIDQEYFYEVATLYPGTVIANEQDIKWILYTEEQSGRWRALRGTQKHGRRVSFTFPQKWYGKKLLVEAFIDRPEVKEPPGMIIMPVPGARSIKRITLSDRNGKRFTKAPKYGQTVKVEIETVNMLGETLSVGLWERDTISSSGHSATDNENIWGTDKSYTVSNANGIVSFSFVLDPGWAIKANRSLFEGSTHEYYLLVKGYGAATRYSHQQDVSDEVAPAERNQPQQGTQTTPKQSRVPAPPAPVQPARTPAVTPAPPAPVQNRPATPATAPQPQTPPVQPTAPGTPAAPATAPVQQQTTVQASGVGADPPPVAGGKSTTTVEENKVEGLTDAYFARKEFTKKTGEAAATFEYTIGSNGNKTGTEAEKQRIAGIILNKAEVKGLAAKKEYTTEEAIKTALTKSTYNKGDKITFATYKLGPEYKKIQNAPLEEKVYLVATTYLLDGKPATVIIKEKDGLLKGAAGAELPVLEITEQQMDDPKAAVDGTEKSTFTGTVQNGMVRFPIQLRPKSDEDLKRWKDTLHKGKEDGNYTYTFAGPAAIADDNEKKAVAASILKNAKGGLRDNPKIEEGKSAFTDDIEKALEVKTYAKGATITFKLYKKQPELLYLQAKATGEKQHDKEFLKQDGAYFEIGRKCVCEERIKAYMRMLRIGEGTGELNKKGQKIDAENGYSMAFGGNKITDLSKHPETNYGGSTAAGAYQVMRYTWWWLNGEKLNDDNTKAGVYEEGHDYIKKYSIPDYQPESQDKVCIVIFKHKRPGILDLITAGKIEEATRQIGSAEWASLPHVGDNSRYKFNGKLQPATPMADVLEHYETFYKEELEGTTTLHLKKGFLKDFDIKCNCGNDAGSGDWHHPMDRMELRAHYGSTADGAANSDHGNAPNRNSGWHDGLDLYAPIGTTVYACVDGTIYEDYISGTYGNTLGIEGTYKGKTYYFFYAHLSKRDYKKGDPVTAGKPIGETGQSGNASGQAAKMNHLHFEVRSTSARTGGRLDPLATISELGTDVVTSPDSTKQTGVKE